MSLGAEILFAEQIALGVRTNKANKTKRREKVALHSNFLLAVADRALARENERLNVAAQHGPVRILWKGGKPVE